ncbi:MAG TPA: response regulator transcription factor [Parafilimonas sp.]|nr:response regulator transcription factor [Parafilimonas sp.]
MNKSILIADDHEIVRVGIKTLISDNLAVKKIDEAGTQTEIIQHVKANFYDLVLLDINIPGCDFIKLMDWLKVTSPGTAVLVFTMHTEDVYGKRCMQIGAKGFLHKTASNNEIIAAINKVLEGKKYINAHLKEILGQSKKETSAGNPVSKLSARELEIALLIHKEVSLPEICTILNIQYSTANTYKRRIFEKLNVHNTLSLSRLLETCKVEG